MNDPNGLVLLDGVWHAHYQHHPDGDVWGPMHWRHATSTDLRTWVDQGIVLEPSAAGQAYSGSVVIDHDDTAGFGAGALVAVFTRSLDGVQSQSLAWSTDGSVWNEYAGNPVLARADEPDFRDPRVMRVGGSWVMSLAVGPVRPERAPCAPRNRVVGRWGDLALLRRPRGAYIRRASTGFLVRSVGRGDDER
jgi:fructan beta-fructosidase